MKIDGAECIEEPLDDDEDHHNPPGERYYWLSFCDGDRPVGTQNLGICIVKADSYIAAVMIAHMLGINPGGECMGIEVPEPARLFAKGYQVDRLYSKAECEKFDELVMVDPHGNES